METIRETKKYLELKLISFKDNTQNLISSKQDTVETNMEATRLEFQSQLEEVMARAERGRGTGACANAAQPPKFHGTTSWALFRRQSETVAEHNCWTRQEKSLEKNCGPRKEFAASGIRMTRCAKVARGREHGLQRQGTDNIAPRTRKGRTEENRSFNCPECKNGISNRGRKQQLRGRMRISDLCGGQPLNLRKERTATNGIEGWSAGQRSHLGSEGTLNKNVDEIFRGKIGKQVVGTSSGLQKIRKWALWRGRPPPKRKKR
jgi:hypothetical protein